MKWIYHRRVTDFAAMTDIGKTLREKLENRAEIVPPKTLFEKQAADGTYKWLLGMDGGNAIEAVFIPETSRGTLCVFFAGRLRDSIASSARPARRASTATFLPARSSARCSSPRNIWAMCRTSSASSPTS